MRAEITSGNFECCKTELPWRGFRSHHSHEPPQAAGQPVVSRGLVAYQLSMSRCEIRSHGYTYVDCSPSGSPSAQKSSRNNVHTVMNVNEYGSIIDTTVPMPAPRT